MTDPRNDKEYGLDVAEHLALDSKRAVRRVLILVGSAEHMSGLQGSADRLAAFPCLERLRVVWTGFAQCRLDPTLLDLQHLSGLGSVKIVGLPAVPRTAQTCSKITIRKVDNKAPVCWNCAVARKIVFENVEGLMFDGEGLCPSAKEIRIHRCSFALGKRGWGKSVETVCISDSSVVNEVYSPGVAVRNLSLRNVRSTRFSAGPLAFDWSAQQISNICASLTHLALDSEGSRDKIASITRFPPRLLSFCGDFYSMDVPVIPSALQIFRARIHLFDMAGTFVWPATIRVASLSFGDYNAEHTAEKLERDGRFNDLFRNMQDTSHVELLRVTGLMFYSTKEAVRQSAADETMLSFGQ